MSTNNFSFENILIVTPDFNLYNQCDECYKLDKDCEHKEEVVDFDQFAFDEYIKDLQTDLEKIGFEAVEDSLNCRNYGGLRIAKWGLEDKTGFIQWLEVFIRNGYYVGNNIDYGIDGSWSEDSGTPRQIEALEKKMDRQVKRLVKVMKKYGKEYLKVGQFSNGEAVYKLKK